MVVFRDDRLDFVAMRRKEAAILLRTGRSILIFRFQVIKVPDTDVHSLGIVVDQSDFFGRVELRQRSYPGPYEKAQVLVFLSPDVRIHKRGMSGVVKGGQKIGFHVVHGFAMKEGLGHSQGLVVPSSHLLLPSIEVRRRFGGSFRVSSQSPTKLGVLVTRESQDNRAEVFVEFRRADVPLEFLSIERSDWL